MCVVAHPVISVTRQAETRGLVIQSQTGQLKRHCPKKKKKDKEKY